MVQVQVPADPKAQSGLAAKTARQSWLLLVQLLVVAAFVEADMAAGIAILAGMSAGRRTGGTG